jgi:hypothetical protein
VFLGLSAIEGIICLIMLLSIPSDQKTAWILGYSRVRFFMLLACLVGILFFISLFFLSWKNIAWTNRTVFRIESNLQNDKISTIAAWGYLYLHLFFRLFIWDLHIQT